MLYKAFALQFFHAKRKISLVAQSEVETLTLSREESPALLLSSLI